eukprot:scaffold92459_cov21-Tisochrysis_lutea.AAC.3
MAASCSQFRLDTHTYTHARVCLQEELAAYDRGLQASQHKLDSSRQALSAATQQLETVTADLAQEKQE